MGQGRGWGRRWDGKQSPQYKLHYMCLPWCYRTMITSYQLPWCYRTMVSSYLLLLKTLFSPTLLLLSYHAITIAPKIYCKWTSLSDRTYRTNLGVRKSKHIIMEMETMYRPLEGLWFYQGLILSSWIDFTDMIWFTRNLVTIYLYLI